jgi:membrane-associated phospholipid phosphatase
MAFIYHHFEAPGAAFPSSHVAIAIVTVSFSFRYLRPIRWLHAVDVLLLCTATVYCRYHYVVDVFAGALAALALLPIANHLYFRTEAGPQPPRPEGPGGPSAQPPERAGEAGPAAATQRPRS